MRIQNWPDRLAQEIEKAGTEKFKFGLFDCCQFCARVAAAITGKDHRKDYLELFAKYENEAEARAIVEKFGGFKGLLTHALGESKPVAFAMRGDIVLCDMGLGPQPSICLGVWCVSTAEIGLAKRMTSTAIAAWTVE